MTTNLRRRIACIEASQAMVRPIIDEVIPVKHMAPEERARLRALLEQYVTDVEEMNELEDGEDDSSVA